VRVAANSTSSAASPAAVHRYISSSVVNSRAVDFYTETKKAQEALVLASGLPCTVLRPTLMFGWFDRKHLGWLARFMRKAPVFPVPDRGDYIRQPLYVGDFCNVIIECLDGRFAGAPSTSRAGADDLPRHHPADQESSARGRSSSIPFRLFWWLSAHLCRLRQDRLHDPPARALVIPESFGHRLAGIFGARRPLRTAIEQTFRDQPTRGRSRVLSRSGKSHESGSSSARGPWVWPSRGTRPRRDTMSSCSKPTACPVAWLRTSISAASR
jgi:hypothetical protein